MRPWCTTGAVSTASVKATVPTRPSGVCTLWSAALPDRPQSYFNCSQFSSAGATAGPNRSTANHTPTTRADQSLDIFSSSQHLLARGVCRTNSGVIPLISNASAARASCPCSHDGTGETPVPPNRNAFRRPSQVSDVGWPGRPVRACTVAMAGRPCHPAAWKGRSIESCAAGARVPAAACLPLPGITGADKPPLAPKRSLARQDSIDRRIGRQSRALRAEPALACRA